MILKGLDKYRDHGLLFLRLGIGISFICHGWPKLAGGPELWTNLGGALKTMGIDFAPAFMGLMAALSEFGGGLFLALGFFFRPASFFLMCTMIVATNMHIQSGDPFGVYSHALKSAILFFSLIWIGPGRFSLDEIVRWPRKKEIPPAEQD